MDVAVDESSPDAVLHFRVEAIRADEASLLPSSFIKQFGTHDMYANRFPVADCGAFARTTATRCGLFEVIFWDARVVHPRRCLPALMPQDHGSRLGCGTKLVVGKGVHGRGHVDSHHVAARRADGLGARRVHRHGSAKGGPAIHRRGRHAVAHLRHACQHSY